MEGSKEWRGMPNEIMLEIVKFTMSPSWPVYEFFPSPMDFHSLKGFGLASKTCYYLFEQFKNDVVYMDNEKPLETQISKLSSTVKHLFVADFEAETIPESLWRILQSSEHLQTLSIPWYIRVEQHLPQLKRCQIRCGRSGCILIIKLQLTYSENYIVNSFPNLTDLSFSSLATTRNAPEIPMDRISYLVPFRAADYSPTTYTNAFRLMKHLRNLNLDIALANGDILTHLMLGHYTRPDHFHPFEHTLRHFIDCPTCSPQADYTEMTEKEDAITLVLASCIPTLETITWLDAYESTYLNGQGRRLIQIQRKDNAIELARPSLI